MAHENVSNLQNNFEASQSRLEAVTGLSAIRSVDLLKYIDDLEKTGSEAVKANPRLLGELAQWMLYAYDEAGQMNDNGRVEPPFTPAELANLQSKNDTYKNFLGMESAEAEAEAEQPSQPQRTSDSKS